MTSVLVEDAPTIFRLLKGVLCIYKPSGVSEGAAKYSLLKKLCNELNEMKCRPPVDHVTIEGDTTKEMTVSVHPSYADHPLVVGPRYNEKDFRCQWTFPLGTRTSGVFLLGLNEGVRTIFALDKSHQLRTFHVHGQFGRATDTYYTDGLVTERSKFQHVTRLRVDKQLATIQAAHQKSMFELCGLNIQSQDAYDMAVKGLLRPADPNIPMIYGIKCVEFKPPDFTIEVHCVNETEFYLMSLINEIGFKCHTNAVCTKLRCIRHSYFTVQNALLRKHWTLEHVIANLRHNQKLLWDNKDVNSPLLKDAILRDPKSNTPLLA